MDLIKKNTVVFISGIGSNLLNLIKFSKKKNSPISINLVLSDNPKANGLNYAKKYNIEYKIVNYKNKKEFEKKVKDYLIKKNICFICLAGFMRVLSENFIKFFKNKIINIHPSLLPKYKGLNTHERVLKNKEKFSGCTVHYVTKKLDSGKIILQSKTKITRGETIHSLAKKVRKLEHIIYPKSINKIFKKNN